MRLRNTIATGAILHITGYSLADELFGKDVESDTVTGSVVTGLVQDCDRTVAELDHIGISTFNIWRFVNDLPIGTAVPAELHFHVLSGNRIDRIHKQQPVIFLVTAAIADQTSLAHGLSQSGIEIDRRKGLSPVGEIKEERTVLP